MTPALRPICAAVALSFALGPAFAQPTPSVEEAKARLLEVVGDEGRAVQRSKRVEGLARLDNPEAARALAECMDKLSLRWESRESKAAETREQYEPYKGFSFKDPKAWDIKKRLRGIMDKEDEDLRADAMVGQAFVRVIAGMKNEDALDQLERVIASNSITRSRQLLYGGLIRNPLTDGVALGKKAFRDSNAQVRLAMLQAFEIRKDPKTADLVAKGLKESGWPHRQAAAHALGAIGSVRGVLPLVNAMAVEDGRLIEDYAIALEKIVGETMGPYPEVWKAWYDDHKDDLVAKGARAGSAKRPKKLVRQIINYYGVKTLSKKVMFIIDISGSMKEEIGQPGLKVVTGEGEDKQPLKGPKIEIAKKSLKRAIRALDESTYFNIIFFNHGVKVFQPKMLKADQDNKNASYLMINDLEPSGATWTYGALKTCFELAGRGATDKAYDPGVDTVFLLSDGAPTTDDVDKAERMDPKIILDAVKEWNALKKVQIHTLAIDPRVGTGRFIVFMRSLASRNGGTYTEIGNK